MPIRRCDRCGKQVDQDDKCFYFGREGEVRVFHKVCRKESRAERKRFKEEREQNVARYLASLDTKDETQ